MHAHAPPLNTTAPRQRGERDKQTGERGYSVCRHSATYIEPTSPGFVHFASVRCAACGRHLHWEPKPATLVRQRRNAFRLAKLSMHPGLTDREREFVENVAQCRKLSPRQQQVLHRLCAQYLGEACL